MRVSASEHKNKFNKICKKRVEYEIRTLNYKRLNNFFILMGLIEVLLIFLYDIPLMLRTASDTSWIYRSFISIHISLLFTGLSAIMIFKQLSKNDSPEKTGFFRNNLPPIFAMTSLILISIINSLDQIKIGHITVFVSIILICSVLVIMKSPASIIVFTAPYIFFAAGLFKYQKDMDILRYNFVNGTILFIAVLFISRYVYSNQYNLILKNISLEEANKKLELLSSYDSLTGLANRRSFEMQLDRELSIIKRYGSEASLVLLDIDYFKRINDAYGHPVGDLVLREFSRILLCSIRDVDVATRWGGEEFLLLLSQTSINNAEILANRIRREIERKILCIDGHKIRITASFGISKLENNFSYSYQEADKALYRAKQTGRNRVIVA